jgi:PAS domain S-box-containing protein
MEFGASEPELAGYLVRATGHGVWDWDVVNDVLTADARCAEIVGCAAPLPPTSLGESARLVHPADREARDLLFRGAADMGGEFAHEHRLRHADGGWRWIRLCGRAVADETGRMVRCVGVVCDITEERRLRESEERLRRVVSATHDGVWEIDLGCGRLWWSDGMFSLLGLDSDSMPEDIDAARALVHPEDLPVLRAALEHARSSEGGAARGLVRLRHSSGAWREVESWAVAETDPTTGDVTRIAGLVHDRTDRVGPAEQLRTLARTLSESVLSPVDVAAGQLKMAALELAVSPERAGDLIDTSSAHLTRVRDAVEELILSRLLLSRSEEG